MKKIETLIVLFTLLLASSCSNELNDAAPVDSSSGVEVSLSLKSSSAGLLSSGSSAQSRSTDPSSVNDTVLHNAWVLQFIGGNFEKKIYKDSGLGKAFGVKLTYNDSGIQSHIYVVANMGEDAFATAPSSEAAFKAGMLNITTEAGLQLSSGSLPMMGELDLEVTESVLSRTLELERMVARVTLKYTIIPSLATELILASARVCNVPDELYMMAPTDGSVFPTTPTLHNGEVTDLTLYGTSDSLVYYLPDNRRGTGSNAGGDATGKSGVEKATYIELIGFYKGDRVEYHLYPGADDVNDYNIVRNTDYTMNITLTGLSTDDKRVVSRSATSNSYIVGTATGSLVYIPVKRANQTTEFGEQLPDLGSGWSSSVIWRDNSSLQIETDDSDKAYGIFKVKVNSSGQSGNALVCIKDGSGTILWSWHIWVTAYNPSSESETYNGYTFMDRNLGATIDVAGNVNALGLLYQWGRKDPFAGASATASGTSTYKTLYSGGSGSTTYASVNTAAPTTSANNLETSVRNPGVFYYNASTPYDWYCGSSTTQNNVLWGTTKTVYDPCPSGWKVAPEAAFSTWSTSTTTWNTTNLGRTFTAASGSWYPAVGRRFVFSGALDGVGAFGYYWPSTPNGTTAYNLTFYSSGTSPSAGGRGNGFGVRCVQEN